MGDPDWDRAGWVSRLIVGIPLGLAAAWILMVWGYRFSIGSGALLGGFLTAAVAFFGTIALVWLGFEAKARLRSWWK